LIAFPLVKPIKQLQYPAQVSQLQTLTNVFVNRKTYTTLLA